MLLGIYNLWFESNVSECTNSWLSCTFQLYPGTQSKNESVLLQVLWTPINKCPGSKKRWTEDGLNVHFYNGLSSPSALERGNRKGCLTPASWLYYILRYQDWILCGEGSGTKSLSAGSKLSLNTDPLCLFTCWPFPTFYKAPIRSSGLSNYKARWGKFSDAVSHEETLLTLASMSHLVMLNG